MAASNVCSPEILKKHSVIPENCDKLRGAKTEDGEGLEIDLSVKCRGCFAEYPEMHYLFAVFDQDLSLADILMETTAFVCKSDDGFPPYLCTSCTSSLIDFFNFKIQLQKTDIYVRTLLENTIEDNVSEIKSESNADDFILNEKYGILQPQFDSQDDNSLDVKDFDGIPDIEKLSGISSLHCEACSLVFNTTAECETHMAKWHGRNPFVKYSIFRKQVAEREKAAVEQRKKDRLENYRIKDEILKMKPGKLCRLCKVKLPEAEFNAHWVSHKTQVCEECGYRCVKKFDLQNHRMSVHTDIKKFSCSFCGKSFKTKPLLRRHELVHSNPRMYCCDLCGQRFNDGGTLKTHIQLKHIRSRDFICSICGLSFPLKATLNKHIKRHNKNRPPLFYCHVCSSSFKDKSSMSRHHLVKHSNAFVKPSCRFCGKAYCSNTKLRYHMERHHSGNVVERQKRGSKRLKSEDLSSTGLTHTEETSDIFDETSRTDSKGGNVDEDYYRSSERYQDDQMEDDPDYVIYRPSHLEETESEVTKADIE